MTQLAMFDEQGTPTPEASAPGAAAAECSAEARAKADTARLLQITEREFLLCLEGATADEVVYRLNLEGITVDELAIRPRVSELKAAKVLLPTGERRKNRKGNSCAVLIHRQNKGKL